MKNKPLIGLPLFISTIALIMSVFLSSFDITAAFVAVPYITGGLKTSVIEGGWIGSMFLIGTAIGLSLSGVMSKKIGMIRLMIIVILGFSFMSILCGLSKNLVILSISRIFQGLFGGPILPIAQSLLIVIFPQEKRNLALTLWNIALIGGITIGPSLGGLITYDISWRLIYLINFPISVFSAISIYIFCRSKETPREKVNLDIIGLIFLSLTVCSLQIILDQGEQLDWWRSNIISILTIIGIVSLSFFIIWSLNTAHPIIEFSFFKNRNFLMGTVLASISWAIILGSLAITPLWLQETMNYTPIWSGLALSTIGIIPIIMTPFLPKLMEIIRLKYLVIFSFSIHALDLFLYIFFTTAVSFKVIVFSRILFGLGVSIWLAPLTAICFAHFPMNKIAIGQGVFQFVRVFSGSIGTSLMNIFWKRRGIHHHQYLVNSVNPYNPISKRAFNDLAEVQIFGKKALKVMDNLAWKQAYMLSLNDIFYIGAWVFVFCILISLFLKKKKAY